MKGCMVQDVRCGSGSSRSPALRDAGVELVESLVVVRGTRPLRRRLGVAVAVVAAAAIVFVAEGGGGLLCAKGVFLTGTGAGAGLLVLGVAADDGLLSMDSIFLVLSFLF